jgi:hypothetical protein
MLPLASRYAGRPMRETWNELHGGLAKLLVLAAYPFSMLLYLASRARATIHRQRRQSEIEPYLRGRHVHTGKQ